MAYRWDVGPNVFQVDPFGVHCISMSAIIPDFTIAMAAAFNWRPDLAEGLRTAFREVQQTVVARIKTARDRKATLHVDGDCMAERHSGVHQMRAKHDVPPGEVVN